MSNVTVVIGAGLIGQAIARRVSAGRRVLVADLRLDNAERAASLLADAGFKTAAIAVDVADRGSVEALVEAANAMGAVDRIIHAAGVSPSQASVETILRVDLYGTALVLEQFGRVIAPGGSAVVIASQSGHRLPALAADEDRALATTPAEALLALPMLAPETIADTLHGGFISGSDFLIDGGVTASFKFGPLQPE